MLFWYSKWKEYGWTFFLELGPLLTYSTKKEAKRQEKGEKNCGVEVLNNNSNNNNNNNKNK